MPSGVLITVKLSLRHLRHLTDTGQQPAGLVPRRSLTRWPMQDRPHTLACYLLGCRLLPQALLAAPGVLPCCAGSCCHRRCWLRLACCRAVLEAAATGAVGCAWRAGWHAAVYSPWVCAQQLQAPALHSLACALSQAVVACDNIVHALLLQHAAGQETAAKQHQHRARHSTNKASAHSSRLQVTTQAVRHGVANVKSAVLSHSHAAARSPALSVLQAY
jgi:hypothetical protein